MARSNKISMPQSGAGIQTFNDGPGGSKVLLSPKAIVGLIIIVAIIIIILNSGA